MAVTIAILSSLCAALAAGCIFSESRNGKLQKTIEESEKRITALENELKELKEQKGNEWGQDCKLAKLR